MRQAESEVEKVNLPVMFLVTFAEKIPLEEDTIDIVLLADTLCTIPNLLAAPCEIKRVL